MEIYIVRHGLSEGNAKMIFQGWIDFSLAPEGRKQSTHVGRYFNEREIRFDRVVSSPFKRAYETTELILSELDNPPEIEVEDAFKELNIGKLEGIKSDEAQAKFPSYYKRPPSGWLDFKEFGGESWVELLDRINDALKKYAPKDKLLNDEKLLIVTHGGAMRAILSSLLDVVNGFMFIRVENCCHFKINHILTRSHLRKHIEYFLPLSALLVNGKLYEYDISDDERARSVS